ncbi:MULTISPECIES: DUF1761 domain-containing protein [Niastella]|uniref:DUF1761 domain-containing protein n=1 Tax=Niastella soli TaxID=2821487 RepID=A0ABS3YP76_9BACT|nr:DUF1761 domain-containing protein [Niastella soli]MBO9199694.1 DUF1761 domain-containing protein [Niastella soli]
MTMNINWWAVLVAGISSFVVGGIWYSPGMFGKAWMKDNNFTEEQIRKGGNKGKIFGFTLMFSLLMAVNLAMFLATPADCPANCAPKADIAWGAMAGFLTGIWTFCAIAIHSLFELKSWRLIFINGFYSVLALILMGAIIGAWR